MMKGFGCKILYHFAVVVAGTLLLVFLMYVHDDLYMYIENIIILPDNITYLGVCSQTTNTCCCGEVPNSIGFKHALIFQNYST